MKVGSKRLDSVRQETTVQRLIDAGGRQLAVAGVDGARREARLLLSEASGLSVERLLSHPEIAVSPAAGQRFDTMIERRTAREPLSRIVGLREFWSLSFLLSPAVLDPRPDSETLIDGLLGRLPDRKADLRVLDLGTGSGCLLLGLLSELPGAWGLGTDIRLDALKVARTNSLRLGLAERTRFVQGDWAAAMASGWSIIVCNPPYIARGEIVDLAPEVARYDPRTALDGGEDGLAAYRDLLPGVAGLLAAGGWLGLEIGAGQRAPVADILESLGLGPVTTLCDLAGQERCLLVQNGRRERND